LRINSAISGTKAATVAASSKDMTRQPALVAKLAMEGRKISWPAALAAVSTPTTSPWRTRNQRAAMNAARKLPMTPQLAPTTTPHSRTSCHDSRIAGVRATAAAVTASAAAIVRLTPKRSISAAANGPIRP
jgi:hypothetical protein